MPATRGELFAGVTVAIVTPFHGGEVDWDELGKLVDWHCEQGTDALAPCGTTGESPTLTHDENERVVAFVCERARCLAINTQTNAGNHGFNTVSKYPRADYICVSENEIRLEARQRRESLEHIVRSVGARMKCRRVMVTRGQQGVLCYGPDEGFVAVPALAGHFTDRVGAGDAVGGRALRTVRWENSAARPDIANGGGQSRLPDRLPSGRELIRPCWSPCPRPSSTHRWR